MLWVVATFSVYDTNPATADLWIGIIYAFGWATVLFASTVVPLVFRRSAIKIVFSAQIIELLLAPIYVLALTWHSLPFFGLVFLISGIIDEIGKGAMPPILKEIAGTDLDHAVNIQR